MPFKNAMSTFKFINKIKNKYVSTTTIKTTRRNNKFVL